MGKRTVELEKKISSEFGELKEEMHELRKLVGHVGSHYNVTPEEKGKLKRNTMRNLQDEVSGLLQEEEELTK